MDAFMSHVLESFRLDAELAARVFPPGAKVVYSFSDRVAMDVLGEYINTLLGQTRIMSPELSLRASAASFVQAWKLVDVSMEVLDDKQTEIPRALIEQTVFSMFEPHIDEYLEDETEWAKTALAGICNEWDKQLGTNTRSASKGKRRPSNTQPQFLTSQNPDQVKRNVLASFKDVLLLPVTIVPRTVTFGVNAIVTGGSHAVQGLSMLNPQKWVASTDNTSKGTQGKMVNGEVIFNGPTLDEPEDEKKLDKESEKDEVDMLAATNGDQLQVPGAETAKSSRAVTPLPSGAATPNAVAKGDSFERLQLLVSIDTALELIHADRESLKRTETFAKYPGKTGSKVVEAVEEVFILLLKAVGDRHIAPGFRM